MTIEKIAETWHEPIDNDPIIDIIDHHLSEQQKIKIYDGFRIKAEYFGDFSTKQGKWMGEHEYYIDENLKRGNLDHSHKTIQDFIIDETIKKKGEAVRFKLYWVAVCRDTFEISHPSKEIVDFLRDTEGIYRHASA